MYRLISITVLSLLVSSNGRSQLSQLDSLAAHTIHILRAASGESASVHTDRSVYAAGETIRFRSFLVNSRTGRLSSRENELFVDMVNERDSVVAQLVLQTTQFQTDGYIPIHDSMPSGFYWVRTYTTGIASRHPELIGTTALYIDNHLRPAPVSLPKAVPAVGAADPQPWHMQFAPEGGAVVSGANTAIVFRITDANGLPVVATGVLKDDHDSIIASFGSNRYGLGKLSFMSWSWRSYRAVLQSPGGAGQVFPLPGVDPFAAQLSVIDNKGIRKLRVVLEDSVYRRDKKTFVLGISGDSLCLAAIGTGSYEVNIPEYRFPYGIADFLLFDERHQLLSERRVFLHGNKPEIRVSADKPVYGPRQPVQLAVEVSANRQPAIASMFIAVTDTIVLKHTGANDAVTAELPLIRPGMELPAGLSEEETDLLMILQQGTVREQFSRGSKQQLDYAAIDSSFFVKGWVHSRNDKPLAGRTVTLFSGNRNLMVLADTTDEAGAFCFPLISYYDQTRFSLQVTDNHGFPEDAKIVLDTMLRFPRFRTPENLKKKFPVTGIREYFAEQRRRSLQDTIVMGKDWLKEVIVHSKAKKPAEFNRDKRVSGFSRILTSKTLQDGGTNNLGNALFKISGVTLRDGYLTVSGGGSQFRHPSPDDEPLLLIDGVTISPDPVPDGAMPRSPLLHYLNTFDFRIIDFIEVVSGPQAAFFGTRGFNGALLIHTKKSQTEIGDNAPNGTRIITMRGYQSPAEFEQPDYSLKEYRNSKFPDRRILLFWNGDLVTDDKGRADVGFYTADPATRYLVTIAGITADGKIVTAKTEISRR
ncbi:MAG: Plug domain-containing protein [Chitinophagaceae bacterium]|nr:Plug domain-containing protein [Chitinophagaceae bacterium]